MDNHFNNEMSYEDVKSELDRIQTERDEKATAELKNRDYSKASDYELIPIDSYSQMNSMFGGHWTGDGSSDNYAGHGGTAWCHANSKSVYDGWVGKSNKFFVLAANNWKDIEFDAESNSQNPKDAYGTSLIAILVNIPTGKLKNATLRCNHVGVASNADNQYKDYLELSDVAGFNVEEKIKEILPEIKPMDWSMFDGSRDSLNKILDCYNMSYNDLTEFNIPDGVTSIGEYAFWDCSELTSITIPNSVTSIGDFAFWNCSGLTSITIPNSVTSIGDFAFWNCSGLTSITIPNSVTSIGEYAFYECSGLTSITIPNSVTNIGKNTFCNCEELTSITIPNSVTSIGEAAFWGCFRLTSITIPNSITSIGGHAFWNCSGLTSITIPNSVTSIGEATFYGCSGLTSITIPNSITSIGEYAFYECSGLTSITIPNSVTNIGKRTFCNCEELTSITIPNSVTSIGDFAFKECDKLTIKCEKGSCADNYAHKSYLNIKVEYV